MPLASIYSQCLIGKVSSQNTQNNLSTIRKSYGRLGRRRWLFVSKLCAKQTMMRHSHFSKNVRNILRRATLKAEEIIELITKLAELAGATIREFPAGNREAQETIPDQMSGDDGQKCPARRTHKIEYKKGNYRCTQQFWF